MTGKNNIQNEKMSNSIEEHFNVELWRSERFRSLILTGLLGMEALVLLIIYGFYKEQYLQVFKSHLAIFAILIFAIVIIIYETLIHYLIKKGKKFFFLNPKFFGYFNSFSEITLLSVLLVFIVEYTGQITILQAPATLTYFVFIVLSTLRLNFKISLFTGFLAAAEFIGISVYYSTTLDQDSSGRILDHLSGMQYLGQGLIMIITGIASGFVADLIIRKLRISYHHIREKNEVINLFGQQTSKQIAASILRKRHELSGTRKQVCMMFLDIRNFTPFVETHPPEHVVDYLNNLFSFMIRIVQSHYGVINQFLGDGFMATFGAPVSRDNMAHHAVLAAMEILEYLNKKVREGIMPPTRLGIGMHYGEAVTGNIGSSIRKQYSITGNVVIIASRIEQLNKKYNSQFLISEEVLQQLGDDTKSKFSFIEKTALKGSKKLISLYKYNESKLKNQ